MSTIYYNGSYQIEVKLKFRICYRPRAFNCKHCVRGKLLQLYWGKLLQLYWVSCYSYIGASCYDRNKARTAHTDGSASELCADND